MGVNGEGEAALVVVAVVLGARWEGVVGGVGWLAGSGDRGRGRGAWVGCVGRLLGAVSLRRGAF